MTKRNRQILLLLALCAALFWALQPMLQEQPSVQQLSDKSHQLPLDDATKQAIRTYIQDVEIAANENSIAYAIQLDHATGRPLIAAGRHRQAYKVYQKILAISYQQGSLQGISIGLGTLAGVFKAMDNATQSYQVRALSYVVSKAQNNPEEYGVVELGFAQEFMPSNVRLGVKWALRARDSLKNTRYKQDLLTVQTLLARGLSALEKHEQASQLREQAWRSAQKLSTKTPDSRTSIWNAALPYARDLQRRGLFAQALEVTKQAIATFTAKEKQSPMAIRFLHVQAQALTELGHTEQAESAYLQAYAAYEVVRATALGERGRAKVDRDHGDLIAGFIRHYLNNQQTVAALALLETNKARTLNDILGQDNSKAQYQAWRTMQSKHAQQRYEQTQANILSRLTQDNKALLKQQAQERHTLKVTLQLQEMTAKQGLSEADVQRIQQQLPNDWAVLSVFLDEQSPSVFVLTKQQLTRVPITLRQHRIRRDIQALQVALSNPDVDYYREPAKRLYQALIEPSLPLLPKNLSTLVYSADSYLNAIPLSVLQDAQDHFLAQRFAIVRVPSLRLFEPPTQVVATHGIACVDPRIDEARLPLQRQTGEKLQDLYPQRLTLLQGAQCAVDTLTDAIGATEQPAFVHIGAHGSFYPADAMDSAIFLSGENADTPHVWNARAMAATDLSHVELITLSSCEAGILDAKSNRDVFGIQRALFFAGAKRIIAPLWSVVDNGTAQLMQTFYRQYTTGVSAAQSLVLAQRALIKSTQFKHPFYWAGFVLSGGKA